MMPEHMPPQTEKVRVPGFPQDMWMPMDEEVAGPETYGLAPGWSGAVGGMMTLVRVFPPAEYEKIVRMIRERRKAKPVEGGQHHH